MSRAPSLITGCSGFIGTNALRLSTSKALVGLDIVPASAPLAQFLSCDIRNLESCEGARAVGASTVIHLASAGGIMSPFSDLGELYETNVTGTLNVLRVFDPDLLVFGSCSSIYGNTEGAASVARRTPRRARPSLPHGAQWAARRSDIRPQPRTDEGARGRLPTRTGR